MASGVKLVYTFTDADGKNVQYSYNNAKPSVTAAQVRTAATALITNTAVLAKTLVSVDSIKQVVTEETFYDLNDFNLATKTPREVINGNPEIQPTDSDTITELTEIKPKV